MNLRTIREAALAFALAISASGCCTAMLYNSPHGPVTSRDRLFPTAVYRETNHHSFAFEGTLYKKSPDHDRFAGSPQEPRYLIIPDEPARPKEAIEHDCAQFTISREDLWASLPPTNGACWLAQLEQAWPGIAADATVRDKLPPDYEKVADLPSNIIGAVGYANSRKLVALAVANTERVKSKRGWHALVPLTVAADIATSPFQLVVAGICAIVYGFD